VTIPDFSTPEAMRGVLERMVTYAGVHSNTNKPRWSHVSDITCHGGGYSAAICREFGADPEEYVGGLKDNMYCNQCALCQECQRHEYFGHDDDCENLVELECTIMEVSGTPEPRRTKNER